MFILMGVCPFRFPSVEFWVSHGRHFDSFFFVARWWQALFALSLWGLICDCMIEFCLPFGLSELKFDAHYVSFPLSTEIK
jgi:hypothetical protein